MVSVKCDLVLPIVIDIEPSIDGLRLGVGDQVRCSDADLLGLPEELRVPEVLSVASLVREWLAVWGIDNDPLRDDECENVGEIVDVADSEENFVAVDE